MAPRTRRPMHDDKTRAKIQTTQLIKRLTSHALEDLDLSPSQVKAIEVLLKKTLPDLKQMEINGAVATITHEQWLDSLEDE